MCGLNFSLAHCTGKRDSCAALKLALASRSTLTSSSRMALTAAIKSTASGLTLRHRTCALLTCSLRFIRYSAISISMLVTPAMGHPSTNQQQEGQGLHLVRRVIHLVAFTSEQR